MSLITAGTYVIGAHNILLQHGLGRGSGVRKSIATALEAIWETRRADYPKWTPAQKLASANAVDALIEAHAALTAQDEPRLVARLLEAEQAIEDHLGPAAAPGDGR